MMKSLTIGQIAARSGVNIMTIRYYERIGLIPEPPRLPSGYRQYPPDTVSRIHFIKSAQKLGFSLKEIFKLLSLRVRNIDNCEEVRKKAEKKIKEIENRIFDLQRIKNALVKLTEECETRTPSSTECPILEALESNLP